MLNSGPGTMTISVPGLSPVIIEDFKPPAAGQLYTINIPCTEVEEENQNEQSNVAIETNAINAEPCKDLYSDDVSTSFLALECPQPNTLSNDFPAVYRGKGTYIYTWVHYNYVEINHECNMGETEFRVELMENGVFDVDFVNNVHASIDFNGTQYLDERINTTFGVKCEFKAADPYDYWDDALWGRYANGLLELNEYTDGEFSGTYSSSYLSGEGYTVYRGGTDNHIINKFYFSFDNLERE
jgi:hypothetical protein